MDIRFGHPDSEILGSKLETKSPRKLEEISSHHGLGYNGICLSLALEPMPISSWNWEYKTR
jgi:hypothetical protein